MMKSSKNFIFGAFSSLAWSKRQGEKEDAQAFLVSLTGAKRVFRPGNSARAVRHDALYGPWFQQALALAYDMHSGFCFTNNQNDNGGYNIPTDA